MKVVQLHGYGDLDQLHYQDVPGPKPGSNQVLVKVAGAGGEFEIRIAKRLKLSEIREAHKIAERVEAGRFYSFHNPRSDPIIKSSVACTGKNRALATMEFRSCV